MTTLTKKMAEELTDYMNEAGIKVKYLHSDIDTLERIEIIRDLRLGVAVTYTILKPKYPLNLCKHLCRTRQGQTIQDPKWKDP
nr:hypothetical protein [Entomobacter blattae]